MPDLQDGQTFEMKGSAATPYILKNVGGVYSCTCPAWRNQSIAIERRTCKHLRKLRGDAAEEARVGGALPQRPVKSTATGDDDDGAAAGPPLLLAHAWDNATNLSGWWMSEKLDGVRAYWDGKQFLSRQGNLFHAPDWFIQGLPEAPLDGELWIDRKKFQRTVSIVRRQDKTDLWKEVRYVVFDAPAAGGGFEERLRFLKEQFARRAHAYAALHDQQLCKDLDCLRAELARVEALGGEGLMLRQPGSTYEAGRSATLLKIKSFKDAEAIVIGHQDGAGKHKGRLGALLVRLPSGKEFAVGTGFSDRERAAPPPIGATITFRYQELSEGGVPRFPSYVGVRADAPAPAGAARGTRGKRTDDVDTPTPIQVVTKTPKPQPEVPMKRQCKSAAAPKPATKCAAAPAAAPKAATKAPAAPRAAAAPKASAKSSAPRYFEYIGGTSAKFWQVSCSGCDMTTRWGRIGSAGQSKTKTFADPATAARQMEKLIEEKTGEGYEEKTPG